MMRVEVAGTQIAKLLDEVVFPVTVNTHRHCIVHDVILLGNWVEDFIDQWLFFMGSHLTEAEVIIKAIFLIPRTQIP